MHIYAFVILTPSSFISSTKSIISSPFILGVKSLLFAVLNNIVLVFFLLIFIWFSMAYLPRMKIWEEMIDLVEEMKLLGVKITNDLRWNENIKLI